MTLLLLAAESQPKFPIEDLTETNAEKLSLAVANSDVLAELHGSETCATEGFRLGHRATVESSRRLYDQADRLRAIALGVTVFEALNTAVVASALEHAAPSSVAMAAVWLTRQAEDEELQRNMEKALDAFCQDMPNTTSAIKEASQRTIGQSMLPYALAGAAVERDMMLTAVAHSERREFE
ncbi:hypothetical protein CR983_01975 [Candidatus Saccharibacteria bacterium]|nr:MAG: hypothetical protein CR983_01975 [Candidatus Saccharibacteria bacterium]